MSEIVLGLSLLKSVNDSISTGHRAKMQVLAERCAKKERGAQKELFQIMAPRMKAVCMRYAADPDQAKDFMQEGFIRLFDKIGQFRGDSSFETWCTRLFINQCLSLLEKEKKRLRREEPISESFDAGLEEDEDFYPPTEYREEDIIKAIQSLPAGYRTVLNMYVFDDLSHAEIAQRLGISESTSKSQLFKARKMMKAWFKKGGDE